MSVILIYLLNKIKGRRNCFVKTNIYVYNYYNFFLFHDIYLLVSALGKLMIFFFS